MEKFINEDTIIKNDIYNLFSDSLICPICKCIMIEPVICLGCQNKFCKNCIENWKKKNICPNRCEDPIYKNIIEKNRLITKFKFKCIKGCGAEIPFNEIKNHYNSNCLKNKNKESKRTIKILSREEAYRQKQINKNIENFTSN